jgi:preprotein translocase subunit YajC
MAGRKKKNRYTILTLFVVMVLLIGIYFQITNNKEKQSTLESADTTTNTTTLAALETEKIESIYFSNPSSTMTLLKDVEAGWIYKEDPSFPVNQTFAENMNSAFSDITSTMTVTSGAENLSEYGLQEPVIQIVATLQDQTSTSIALGYEVPITGGYYATVNGATHFLTDKRKVDEIRFVN